MEDINKKKRKSLWLIFILSVVTTPFFFFFGDKQISPTQLVTIDGLTLSQAPDYTTGRNPRINIYLTNTGRILVVNLEELRCVDKDEILNSFKESDTVSIKILSSDRADFYQTGTISQYQKIYGLKKNAKEYIELSCRNSVSTKKNMAGIYANTASAILSLFFATVWFKSKSKQEASKQMNIDPSLIVGICWLLIIVILRRR